MADQVAPIGQGYQYYQPEYMEGRRLSELQGNRYFLDDAITFLKSQRKAYTDDDLRGMTAEQVVDDVLEHFRVVNTNEVSMSRDFFYINSDNTTDPEKQAYARLMYAFDNARGENLFTGGGQGLRDYAEGVLTAPSTYATAIAIPTTAGAGSAAVQGSKQASLLALRGLAKKHIGRSLVVGAMDGVIAGGSAYGLERLKGHVSESIGEDYETNLVNVGAAALLGGTFSGGAYYAGVRGQAKRSAGLADVLETGRAANVAESTAALEAAEKAITAQMSRDEAKLFEWTTEKLYRAIDPKLVEEGVDIKKTLLSDGLGEGLIGGLDRGVVKRLSAAAYDLAKGLRVKPEEGQRITEYLARAIESGEGVQIFDTVAQKYGLSRRQLSAVYAAEVSEAAKLLAAQRNIVSNGGVKLKPFDAATFRAKLDELYDNGMSVVSGREASELDVAGVEALTGLTGRVWRGFKQVENARRAFMTSQPATTMRNNIFGVAMGGIDMVDQIFQASILAVKGKRAAAVATRNHSLDVFKYLTRDSYVAEALTTLLSQEAPQKMSRLFSQAAQVEAGLVKDTKLARLGNAVNVLNTLSDHVFKRAVIAGTIDRELAKLGNETLGTSLMDMLEKGTLSKLPDDILEKALNESFAFTFQRRFGGKDASATNAFVGKTIKFIHDTGLTVAIPFPRYIASQAKFISDYTGLTIARKGFRNATTEQYSKFMTGAAMFGGAYMIQKDNIKDGREWYEAEGYDGQIYNAQAALGPAAMHAFTANTIARVVEGEAIKDPAMLLREFAKIGAGTEFRPNSGISDKIFQAIDAGDMTPVLDLVGDYFSSYTYPAAVVKDFYGQFDPRSAYLPETRDPTATSFYVNIPLTDTGFDIRLSSFQRVFRQLPDFDFDKVAGTLKDISGIDLTSSQIEGMFKYMGGAARTQYQTELDPTGGDNSYDMIRFDIFSDGPLKVNNPFVKQITGFVGVQPKNELQREMSRLQLDPFQMYNPYKEKNPALEVLTQGILQGVLPAMVKAKVLDTAEYKAADDGKKRLMIKSFITGVGGQPGIIADARAAARETLQGMQGKSPDFDAYVRGEVMAMTRSERSKADLFWEEVRGELGYEGLSYRAAIDAIKNDETLDADEIESRTTTLALLYLKMPKALDKGLATLRD